MKHHRLGVGVVEEVRQLLGAVAIVGVDRCQAGLESREIGLQILRAIIEKGRDLRLALEPRVDQMGGQRVGAGVKLYPADDSLALNQRRALGLSR